jgi:hypothetical protein
MALPCFDLDAPIIPGISAAGFSLGLGLEKISHLLSASRVEKVHPKFNAVRASEENEGLLYLEYDSWSSLEYRGSVVRVDFNGNGKLSSIWVFEGYRGRLLNTLRVGSSMHEVKKLMPIFYDDCDEMFYPDREAQPDLPFGVGFIAAEEEEEGSSWVLHGISIHDYERF